jgi:DNA-binding NtrC family response regulator
VAEIWCMDNCAGPRRTTRVPRPKYFGPWQLEVGAPGGAQTLSLAHGHRVVLGSGAEVDVRVEDDAVSQLHIELTATEEGLNIRDLESTNGTYVGSARVRRAVLAGTGGTIVIGRTTVTATYAEPEVSELRAPQVPGLVGSTFVMRKLAADIARYAKLQAAVLVVGETGSGKEVVAKALHELSGRGGAFVPVNVGGLSEALADAELFGHSRGAFTGAVSARVGAFQQAGAGTLFLDEIADLAPSIQVKLLRVLEERVVRPLGGAAPVPVRARIVSACWAAVDDPGGPPGFRRDLFHRIATVMLRIPPLRQRKADISALSRAVLARHESELGFRELTPRALARLVEYDWPGNVRELGSVLYRAAALAPGRIVDVQQVHAALPMSGRKPASLPPEDAVRLLDQHGRNVSKAARAAGVPRSTFRAWLRRAQTSAA